MLLLLVLVLCGEIGRICGNTCCHLDYLLTAPSENEPDCNCINSSIFSECPPPQLNCDHFLKRSYPPQPPIHCERSNTRSCIPKLYDKRYDAFPPPPSNILPRQNFHDRSLMRDPRETQLCCEEVIPYGPAILELLKKIYNHPCLRIKESVQPKSNACCCCIQRDATNDPCFPTPNYPYCPRDFGPIEQETQYTCNYQTVNPDEPCSLQCIQNYPYKQPREYACHDLDSKCYCYDPCYPLNGRVLSKESCSYTYPEPPREYQPETQFCYNHRPALHEPCYLESPKERCYPCQEPMREFSNPDRESCYCSCSPNFCSESCYEQQRYIERPPPYCRDRYPEPEYCRRRAQDQNRGPYCLSYYED